MMRLIVNKELTDLVEEANQATVDYCLANRNYSKAVKNNDDDNVEELYDEYMRLDRVRLDCWKTALKHAGIKYP